MQTFLEVTWKLQLKELQLQKRKTILIYYYSNIYWKYWKMFGIWAMIRIGRCCLKYKWLVLQHLWPIKFVNFALKTKLSLLSIPTDPRSWVILNRISKHVKNLSKLLKKVVFHKKIISLFYNMRRNKNNKK